MRGSRWAPVVVAGALMLIALLAAYGGPVRVGDPVLPLDRFELQMPDEDEDDEAGGMGIGGLGIGELDEPEFEANPFTIGVLVFALLLAAVAVVIVVLAAVAALRRLRHLRWTPPQRDVVDDGYDIRIDTVLATAADDAVRDAEAALPGESTDAVIACWIRLERAAEHAGAPRSAHETPSEFTAALLAEQDADREAVAEMLALYHRARFGSAPLPDAAGEQAARALRRIAATLRPSHAGGDGSR